MQMGIVMRKILMDSDKTFSIYNIEDNIYPVVISIPHSGMGITPDMEEKLVDDIILPNMDWYLPELYSFLPDMGFIVIINHVSRYSSKVLLFDLHSFAHTV